METDISKSKIKNTHLCKCEDCKFLRRNFHSMYSDVILEFDGTCQITKLPANEEFGCYDKFQKIVLYMI